MAQSKLELAVETGKWDAGLKRAQQALSNFTSCHGGLNKALQTNGDKMAKFAKMLGSIETSSKSAKGRMSELNNAFTEASITYKRLTDEEKQSPFGKALSASVEQLKGRLQSARAEMAEVQKELGTGMTGKMNTGDMANFKEVLSEIGGQMGVNSNLLNMVTSGTVAYAAAAGTAVAVVAKLASEWAEYNLQLAKQDQTTMVTTGLKGNDVQKMTNEVRSLVDVYDVDFREAVNGLNTLMQQFGISADEAMTIMEKGMQGMLEGDGQKLLQMIQQYAPAYRDAGVSASELVAIINNTEGGIFTDQNMAAITMGIKNIRLMKDTTKESLKEIGVDADEMSKKLNDGSMSVFEALKVVSDAVQNVGSGSQAAGQVMNDIFGKQGVAAGTNLGKAIATLNTNLDETSKQTSEVGEKLYELQQADKELQGSLRTLFGLNAEGWEQMKLDIETKALKALNDVVKAVDGLITKFQNLPNAVKTAMSSIATGMAKTLPVVGQLVQLLSMAKALGGGTGTGTGTPNTAGGGKKTVYKNSQTGKVSNTRGGTVAHYYKSKDGKMISEDAQAVSNYDKQQELLKKLSTTKGGKSGGGSASTNGTGKTETPALEGSIDYWQKLMTEQGKIVNSTADASARKSAQTLYEEYAKKIKELKMLASGGTDMSDLEGTSVISDATTELEKLRGTKIELKGADNLIKQGNGVKLSWQEAASAVGQIGSALQQIQDPAVKVFGIIAEAIANVAGGLMSAFAKDNSSNSNLYAKIAAGVAATATMVSMIASIHSATGYARGGVVRAAGGTFVPGNSMSGDMVPAMLNSGELVLNKAQQGNLASQLDGANVLGNLHLETELRSDKLVVMLNNGLRKRGKGTLVTSRR